MGLFSYENGSVTVSKRKEAILVAKHIEVMMS